MAKRHWTKWQGGHGAVKAETLELGTYRMDVHQLPGGQWEAKAGGASLGEFASREEAQTACLFCAQQDINETFGDLKYHEALRDLGKGAKGRRA